VPTSIGVHVSSDNAVLPSAASSSVAVHARRRRPAPPARPLRSATSQAAAEKIASLAEVRKTYYMEKLAMKRKQHELQIRVLELQEKIAVKQLRQLEE